MSANGQVIKAAQMFVKQGAGASKTFNLKAEMLYGTTLGIGVGLTWKVMCVVQWSVALSIISIMPFVKCIHSQSLMLDNSKDACRCTTGMRKENKQSITAHWRG